MMDIDELLQTPYWIIDILPVQVPENSPGQYFVIEKYYREPGRMADIKRKHVNVILKLNCYMAISLDDTGEINDRPERIEQAMRSRYVNIRVGDALIISEPEDTHMTVFNADDGLMDLVRALATAEGMFVWQPPQPGNA